MKQEERYKIINGNNLEVLPTFEDNSVDAIITDPPYELNFMNKGWDSSGIAYNVELWKQAWRVLKHGGYLLAFGGTRTYHRIACAIEDAGFEIRDCIMWLYGSGFPKSLDIGKSMGSKILNGSANTKDFRKLDGEHIDRGNYGYATLANNQGARPRDYNEINEQRLSKVNYKTEEGKKWSGWGTALKPSYEPIIVARKPVENTVVDNVLKWGVGGINIDECRIETADEIKLNIRDTSKSSDGWKRKWMEDKEKDKKRQEKAIEKANELGRFPANTILTYDETDFDEVCGGMPNTKGNESEADYSLSNQNNSSHLFTNIKSGKHFGDEGSAARYFYCAKASKKDRDNGLMEFDDGFISDGRKAESDRPYLRKETSRKNIHPTVKPVELMQYLVRLVSPKGATILDIFNGSGSTGKAVAFENRERNADYKYIGIELDPQYCEISKGRIDYAVNKYQYDILEEVKEHEEKGQLTLFDFKDL